MSRHEIQILRAAGMGQVAVAAKTGTSVRSVRRIQAEPPVTTSETAALIAARRVGRPSVVAPWAAVVSGWLADERELPSGEILRRLRDDHQYVGGKSAWRQGCDAGGDIDVAVIPLDRRALPPPNAWPMTWLANGKRAIPKRPLACSLISMLACAILIFRRNTGNICALLIRWKVLSRPCACALMPPKDSALLAVACI